MLFRSMEEKEYEVSVSGEERNYEQEIKELILSDISDEEISEKLSD